MVTTGTIPGLRLEFHKDLTFTFSSSVEHSLRATTPCSRSPFTADYHEQRLIPDGDSIKR